MIQVDLTACNKYLKKGESLEECLARNREDCNSSLEMLARERARVEKMEAAIRVAIHPDSLITDHVREALRAALEQKP